MQSFHYGLLAIGIEVVILTAILIAPEVPEPEPPAIIETVAPPAMDPEHRPSLGGFVDVYGVDFQSRYDRMDADESEDHHWLSLAVYFEARNQSLAAQMAVAQVVINRQKDRRWPSTIRGVVSQGRRSNAASWRSCQFSFMCDGLSETPHNRTAWKVAREISLLALDGSWPDLSGGATHYHTKKTKPPIWTAKMTNAGTAGDHQLWIEAD